MSVKRRKSERARSTTRTIALSRKDLEVILVEPSVESGAGEPELLSGLRDVAPMLVERLLYKRPFGLVERGTGPGGPFLFRPGGRQEEVFGAQDLIVAQDERPLHRVLEFADIAGPVIV